MKEYAHHRHGVLDGSFGKLRIGCINTYIPFSLFTSAFPIETLCVIFPHIVSAKVTGAIRHDLLGFGSSESGYQLDSLRKYHPS